MTDREKLFVSLSLSPWSLGLKQLLRGMGPLGGLFPRGERILDICPSTSSHAVLILAWSYWLLDGCNEKPEILKEEVSLILDCSLAQVRLCIPRRTSRAGLSPGGMKGAGEGCVLVEGEEVISFFIAPGTEGGIGIKKADPCIPWIFPEGDGLHYYGNNPESRILPVYLIDEALNFADAVSKVMLEYGKL